MNNRMDKRPTPERNDPCPCGSGMKFKMCHGDPALKQIAARITNHMMTLFIVQRCHEKGIADADQTQEAIERLVAGANEHLPESVKLVPNFEIQEGESEPELDKLQQKEEEGGCLSDIQAGTELCGCGRRLPAGMKCAKCNPGETK